MNSIFKLFFFIFLSIISLGCNSQSNNNSVGNTNKILGCIDIEACNYVSEATVDDNSCIYDLDACSVCGGSAVSSTECSTNWNVYYDVSTPISGFQFKVEGMTVLSGMGGAAEEAGFSVTTGSTLVLGFSLSGATIQSGDGNILTVLSVTGDVSTACLSNPIFSNSYGEAFNVEIIDCQTIREI